MAQPAVVAIFAAAILVAMPPDPTADAEPPPMASISGVISRTSGISRAVGIAVRIGGVQAGDIRQQQQAIGADHLRHARREPIVVAVADFGGGHRVVLVDDRQRTEPQQLRQRGARIQIAAPVFAVFERQQNLRHGDAGGREQLLIDVRQCDLAHGGGGLALSAAPAARLASLSSRRPSAMAPEDTSTTSCLRARRRSRSSTRVSSQGRLTCPFD